MEHLKTSQSFQQKHTVQPNYGKQNMNTTFRETIVCNLSMLTKNYSTVLQYSQDHTILNPCFDA